MVHMGTNATVEPMVWFRCLAREDKVYRFVALACVYAFASRADARLNLVSYDEAKGSLCLAFFKEQAIDKILKAKCN